jgi:hypothetical protein
MRATRSTTATRTAARPIATVALTWFAMIGVDLVLHAGVLAPLYDWTSPFLLSPADAFVRIPIGYLSLLILAVGLTWLLPRFDVERGRDGARIAGAFGAVIWGALVLGLWSISTADPALLVGWWIGQTLELGLGGFVIGSVQGGAAIRALAWKVGALVVLGVIAAVLLQSIGFATAPVIAR